MSEKIRQEHHNILLKRKRHSKRYLRLPSSQTKKLGNIQKTLIKNSTKKINTGGAILRGAMKRGFSGRTKSQQKKPFAKNPYGGKYGTTGFKRTFEIKKHLQKGVDRKPNKWKADSRQGWFDASADICLHSNCSIYLEAKYL